MRDWKDMKHDLFFGLSKKFPSFYFLFYLDPVLNITKISILGNQHFMVQDVFIRTRIMADIFKTVYTSSEMKTKLYDSQCKYR